MISDLKYNEADSRIYFLSEGNNSIIACKISPKNCTDIYNGTYNQSQIQFPMAFAVNGAKDIFVAHDQKIAKLSLQQDGTYSHSVLRDKTVDVIAMAVYDKSQRVNGKLWHTPNFKKFMNAGNLHRICRKKSIHVEIHRMVNWQCHSYIIARSNLHKYILWKMI